MPESCAAIVLAAGASTRLGQPKQLLTFDGESLLRRSIRLAIEAGCSPVFIVLGSEVERMRQELRGLPAKVVVNQDWQSGMGSSLRAGAEMLLRESPLPERTLLLVCDQVRLSVAVLHALLADSLRPGCLIAAAQYAGRLGVPAVFHHQLYPDLLRVEGDQGARTVIQRYKKNAAAVDFPEGAFDIDTAEDIASLKRLWAVSTS